MPAPSSGVIDKKRPNHAQNTFLVFFSDVVTEFILC